MSDGKFEPYWASVPSHEISDRILEKVEEFYEFMQASGRLDLIRRSWAYYYRPRLTGASLNLVGQQGELTAIAVNHYRNLLLHLETMTVQQRANFEPRATNSDVKSQAQVILSAGLLDHYMGEKRLERNLKLAVKDCLIGAESFVRAEWNATGGKQYGVTPEGAPQYEGDMKYTNYSVLDNVRDFRLRATSLESWNILRDFQNKYDLAAKFPELADRILEDSDDELELCRTTTLNYLALENSDKIAVYTLIHKPTPAMPEGRYTECLHNGTVLLDGPLPYKETHVYRIAPDEELGTIFGYSVGFDLLPIQECLDMMYSTVASNQATFGVQNILMPKGHDVSTSQMAGGLNIIEVDPKLGFEPKGLNLTSTPPEIFEFIKMLEQIQQTIAGVDGVTRGDPEKSLKSGAALALVQSQSIQFAIGLQQSYAQLVEDIGTGTINILKTFAAVPRVAAIAGKSNRPLMREFTGDDVAMIDRVTVDMGNPMTRTTAGKVNLADAFMERGMISNPDQYIQVVTTGRLEPVIEGKQAQLLLIKAENEGLAEGQPQRAIITDNHAQHILEHSVVNASPEARLDQSNPALQVTLDHIQEHINLAQSPGYQMMAQMLGHQIMVPMMQPPPADGGTAEMLDGTPQATQEAQQVQMPNMPNPPSGTDPASAEVIESQAG